MDTRKQKHKSLIKDERTSKEEEEKGIKESKNNDGNVLHTFAKWYEFVIYNRNVKTRKYKMESIDIMSLKSFASSPYIVAIAKESIIYSVRLFFFIGFFVRCGCHCYCFFFSFELLFIRSLLFSLSLFCQFELKSFTTHFTLFYCYFREKKNAATCSTTAETMIAEYVNRSENQPPYRINASF